MARHSGQAGGRRRANAPKRPGRICALSELGERIRRPAHLPARGPRFAEPAAAGTPGLRRVFSAAPAAPRRSIPRLPTPDQPPRVAHWIKRGRGASGTAPGAVLRSLRGEDPHAMRPLRPIRLAPPTGRSVHRTGPPRSLALQDGAACRCRPRELESAGTAGSRAVRPPNRSVRARSCPRARLCRPFCAPWPCPH